jgi:16S rRNA (cytosine967-C5)-methyltransferase
MDLAERIEIGVITHLLSLRWLVSHHADRSLRSIDDAVQKILCVALYQLRFLDRIPEAVIADQAVEQTRRMRLGRAIGFVNAVLRKAAARRFEPIDVTGLDPIELAERLHSHPRELTSRLISLFGTERALMLAEGHNRIAPTIARLGARGSIEALQAIGLDAIPHHRDRMVVLRSARGPLLASAAENDLAQVMDATSAAVVDDLDIGPGMRVLDRCCGRGTKTLLLARRVGLGGRVVAIDSSPDRIADLRRSIERHALRHIEAIAGDSVHTIGSDSPFDLILADVPCSNSGVLSRRPAARYRQTLRHLESLAAVQRTILDDSLPVLAPGGRLIYATCSIWPEENERAAEAFARDRGLRIESMKSTTPNPDVDATQWHDGGFVAVMSRAG